MKRNNIRKVFFSLQRNTAKLLIIAKITCILWHLMPSGFAIFAFKWLYVLFYHLAMPKLHDAASSACTLNFIVTLHNTFLCVCMLMWKSVCKYMCVHLCTHIGKLSHIFAWLLRFPMQLIVFYLYFLLISDY